MNRSKRFASGIITGYGNIAANIIFTILSVPLALAYLSKESFGLWALAVQISGYLSLLELGTGNAINRHVLDHKDNVNGGNYGSYLLTSGIVCISQGILVATVGYAFSWIAPNLFKIPEQLINDFRHLLILLSTISGFSIAIRAIGSPLWAFQRLDVINCCFIIQTLSSLAMVWLGFSLGWGVKAFAYATIPGVLITGIYYFLACRSNKYYPQSKSWGKPNMKIFAEIFSLARDFFLIQIGLQIINASQIIIISRMVSLDAAATFAISTKVFSLGRTLISNPISSSISGLTELYVRGETRKLTIRYQHMLQITLSMAIIVASGIAASNRFFIKLWTDGEIQWSWVSDLLLALSLVLITLNSTQIGIFGITKSWHRIRYIYLIEGLIFIVLGILLSKHWGINGVLIASIIAPIVSTTPFVIKTGNSLMRIPKHFYTRLIWTTLMIAAATVCNFVSAELKLGTITNILVTMCITILASFITWKIILDKDLKMEILSRFDQIRLRYT